MRYESFNDMVYIDDDEIGIHLSEKKKGEELHGPQVYYFSNGRLSSETWYVHGKRWGRALFYLPSGYVKAYLRYVNGLQHGVQEYFYDEGPLKTYILYAFGVVQEVQEFYLDGSFRRIIDEKIGKDLFFLPDGTLLLD